MATFSNHSGVGVELTSSDGQLLDATGMPFHWGPDDGSSDDTYKSSTPKMLSNGVQYTSGMPWAKRDHWSAAETSDTSPNRLVEHEIDLRRHHDEEVSWFTQCVC